MSTRGDLNGAEAVSLGVRLRRYPRQRGLVGSSGDPLGDVRGDNPVASRLVSEFPSGEGSGISLTEESVQTASFSATVGSIWPVSTALVALTATITAPSTSGLLAIKLVTLGTGNAVTINLPSGWVLDKPSGSTSTTLTLSGQSKLFWCDTVTQIITTLSDDLSLSQLDARYLELTGGTMSGVLAMGSHKITGLATGVSSTDAANVGQLPAGLPTQTVVTVGVTGVTYGFGTPTYTVAAGGTYTWTCPAGVTSVDVECWGGGGGGGGANVAGGGGGGAGGDYAKARNVPVVPGNAYSLIVGAGGTAGASSGASGGAGGASVFKDPGDSTYTERCYARGGAGGVHSASGAGGASNLVNTPGSGSGYVGVDLFNNFNFTGGAGAAGGASGASAGNGGGGAGDAQSGQPVVFGGGLGGAGNNVTGGTGGVAGSSGGTSGAGGAGAAPSGGGAGGYKSSTSEAGGAGGAGLVRITYPAY